MIPVLQGKLNDVQHKKGIFAFRMEYSLVAQMVKNMLAMRETWARSLGWEDPLEEGVANPLQDSCLENPCGQRSHPQGLKESDVTEQLRTAQHRPRKYAVN